MRRDTRLSAVNGALGMTVVLLVVQMWLLTATLEAYLAGHRDTAIPGAIVSAVLFAACVALHLFVGRVDRRARRDDAEQGGSRADLPGTSFKRD